MCVCYFVTSDISLIFCNKHIVYQKIKNKKKIIILPALAEGEGVETSQPGVGKNLKEPEQDSKDSRPKPECWPSALKGLNS